jgi:uncharacterized SAM-binding protein YcdF (DUF218 family)
MTYTEPLLFLLSLLALAGFVRALRGGGVGLAGLALLSFFLISWPPLDWVLSRPLEAWYPVRPFQSAEAPQAIVALSSSVDPPHYERPYEQLGGETYQRCEYAAWLYRRYHVPVLTCGGKGSHDRQSAAASMQRQLVLDGIPESMIWTEDRSGSTHENALYGAEILRAHGVSRIALVVEAQGMPRAAASFRKQGLTVIPAPCHFREWTSLSDEVLPSWKAIRRNEGTLHETIGLIWYRLHGWI